jgi:hypothetical protein
VIRIIRHQQRNYNNNQDKSVQAKFYNASPIKRQRATAAEMQQRADFLIDYAEQHGPVTVRGLYYQAEVAGLPGIDKSDNSYNKIQRQVLQLRRTGQMPYRNIADATRWMRKPSSYDGVADALEETARTYRKALWIDTDDYVEIWCEKDALAGVIYPVTSRYDVPLMVTRGFSSETFCFEAVAARKEDERDFHIYNLADFDRAGQDAARALEEKLKRFGKEFGITIRFHSLALTKRQVELWQLPTREPKRKSRADKKWPHDFACELDAIPADQLRDLVDDAIMRHLPLRQFEIAQIAEESEREVLRLFAKKNVEKIKR